MKKRIFIILCIIGVCSGCLMPAKGSELKASESYGFVVKSGDYLFYYHDNNGDIDLYRYNAVTKEKKFVDSLFKLDMSTTEIYEDNLSGFASQMYLLDNRIYYAKGADEHKSEVYSIDVRDIKPRYEGTIKINSTDDSGWIGTVAGDRFVDYQYEMFKWNSDIYVLSETDIYKLDCIGSKIVADDICALCVYEDNIYYSKSGNEEGDRGIFCYNTDTKQSEQIISEEEIYRLNETELLQDSKVQVSNIVVDNDYMYFLGTWSHANIFKYNLKTKSTLCKLSPNIVERLTRRFKLDGEKIYYIPYQYELRCHDLKNDNNYPILENISVFSFNVYSDELYYYVDMTKELRVHNLQTDEDYCITQG